MGAIWGAVDFSKESNTGFEKMQPVYEKKCKIDKYGQASIAGAQMGAGILYVRKVDEAEVLPVKTGSDLLLTADCLLDNRDELLTLVEGTGPEMPDGLLIARLYEKYGVECFGRLRGLFSIAIFDSKGEKLILAADPVASRCLYYYRSKGVFYFSTLIEPIKQAVGGIEKNWQYLEDFMMVPGMMPNLFSDDTPYLGVKKCNPGEWLEVTSQGMVSHSYFSLAWQLTECRAKNASQYGKYFRELYEKCVADAITTDGQVAISISSGLDSASIGVLAAPMLEAQGKRLMAYTYVPEGEATGKGPKDFVFDETRDVLSICKPFSNIENNFVNNEGKNCIDEIEKCVDILEIPFKAFVNFPNLCEIFSKASKSGCKVVLTGQMGNTSVSHGYIDDVLFDLYEKGRYFTFLKYLNKYSKTVGESRRAALKGCRAYFNHSKGVKARGIQEYEGVNSLLRAEFSERYPYKERFTQAGMLSLEHMPMDEEMHRQFMDNKAPYTYMGEYETKLGLRYGLVIRDATKDIRMLRFCYNLPYEYFAYEGTPRYLIRSTFTDVLPKTLLEDWMRYGVQNCDWLRRVKRDWESEGLGEKLMAVAASDKLQQYVDGQKVEQLVDEILGMDEGELDLRLSELGFLKALEVFDSVD